MKSKKNLAGKPYNRCLYCPKRLSNPRECNGPRTGSMKTDRWREYMRDIKDVDGLTFEEIAARTEGQMSAASIQNALAPGATRDLTRETARIIENAVFGMTVAHPCPFEFLENMDADSKRVKEVEDELAQLRQNIKHLHDSYNIELDKVRDEYQRKIDYLLKDIDRKDSIIDKLLK